jgi:amidase
MFEVPSQSEFERLARKFGLTLGAEEAAAFARLARGLKPSYDRLAELAEARKPAAQPRDPGRAPSAAENPYGAWAWRCEIAGEGRGLLSGMALGIKDNICVAGLPLRNGSRTMDGFVAAYDATVVTRILAAGGTIFGKTVCEDLCFSGGSHTSHPAPVRNPHNPRRSAGGSSSGSAAAIVAGDVPICLGGDQGGSIRTPSAWSGCVGLKPTHGLVPYTGVFSIEPSLDHCGPMGRSVEDVARLLTVIAGPDGLDPRQRPQARQDYLDALGRPVERLRIGVLEQGFGRPESEAATDDRVRRVLAELASSGVEVESVSIPWHLDAYHLYTAIVVEGSAEIMFKANGMSYGWEGEHAPELTGHWAQSWRSRPDRLPVIAKYVLLMAEHLTERHHGTTYAKAQRLRREMRAAYDAALKDFNVLALPTIPFRAPELPDDGAGAEQVVAAALDMEGNTGPFDASGHPAISVPCGMEGGLPVGLMFVGRHFDEAAVLRAARRVEMLGDWKTL